MAKVDLHIHSLYSRYPSNWFLKKIDASESYTKPETLYQMAKERGMAFATITDHDEISGSLMLAEKYADAFTGTEISTYFPEDGCKIHLLAYGLTGRQFEEIQRIRNDIYQLRDFLVEQKLAHAVAHATCPLNARLSISHLEKLVLLFDNFETANGAKSHLSNGVWEEYLRQLTAEKIATLQARHGIKPLRQDSWIKGFTGGSNDHAGLHIGLTYTSGEATDINEFLGLIRDRQTVAGGRCNYFTDFIFAIGKVALDLAQNKGHKIGGGFPLSNLIDFIYKEKRASLKDRLAITLLKADRSNVIKRRVAQLIDDIRRQEKPSVEKNLELLYSAITDISDDIIIKQINAAVNNIDKGNIDKLLDGLSDSMPAIFLSVPFFLGTMSLNNNRPLLNQLSEQLPTKRSRKILWFSDTFNDMNGVSVTLKKLGWKFSASGIDFRFASALLETELSDELPPNFMNLEACYSFRLPYYKQYIVKIPSLLKALKKFNEYEPDEIFISTPGPMGMLGALTAKLFNIPMTGIYHTDFYLELKEIVEDDSIVETMEGYTRWFYSLMDDIKVPTTSYMDILERRGYDRSKMSIFPRHIDKNIFSYCPPEKLNGAKLHLPAGLNLLYVGRISKDKNLEFLINVYREARRRVDDINLIVTGNGPFLKVMKAELDHDRRVVFTGRLPNETLPLIYSQAHTLVFPSITDTFGMAVLEAQCCRLPALVSDQGGPQDIIEDGQTGHILPALHLEKWVEAILQMNNLVKNSPERYEEIRIRTRSRALRFSNWDTVFKQLSRQVLVPRPLKN